MTEHAAQLVWTGIAIYAAIGLLVTVALNIMGLQRIGSDGAAPPWRVRIVLAPGLTALWPLLLLRLIRGKPREDRT